MSHEEDVSSRIALPMPTMIRFLTGFFLCGLLWMTAFNSASMVLLPQRLKDDGFADPNGMIAQLNAAGAIVALCANIVFGSLSDRSRSRFGRRTPFMIGGAIASGTCLFLVAVAQQTITIIAERWGRRKPLLIIAAILLACGFLTPRLVPSVPGFYIYGVLAGLGYGTYNASNQALSIDVLPNKDEAGKGLGILNLANTSGMILAAVITSSMYAVCGTYRPVFIGAALMALISVPCIATIKSAR